MQEGITSQVVWGFVQKIPNAVIITFADMHLNIFKYCHFDEIVVTGCTWGGVLFDLSQT